MVDDDNNNNHKMMKGCELGENVFILGKKEDYSLNVHLKKTRGKKKRKEDKMMKKGN